MKTSVSIEFKSTVTFSRPLSKDSLLVSVLQYLLDPHAERGHTVSSRPACTLEQQAVSVLERLGSQTRRKIRKRSYISSMCHTAGRRVQKERSGFTSLNPGPYLPHQILSYSF